MTTLLDLFRDKCDTNHYDMRFWNYGYLAHIFPLVLRCIGPNERNAELIDIRN